MPATAGRVRMPANNRVHSSAALQTHGIWQSAIGYDPYAPNKDDTKSTAQPNVSNDEPDGENAYASFQGLLALARITGSSADETRGSCSRCGRVGHLKFQCRNFLSVKEDKEREPEGIQGDVASELARLKRKIGRTSGKKVDESEDEDEDSESEDSDYDSEIEKIIAQKNGLKIGKKEKSKKKDDDSDDDGSDSDSGKRKRGRSKKRRSSKRKYDDDSDEGRKRKRKEKRRKRDESSDEDGERRRRHRKSRKEKRRRRSHRHSDDSESDSSDDSRRHRSQRSRKAATPSDSDDDSRVGRGRKRSEKKSRKRHHKDDE